MDKQLIDMYYLYGWTGVNISLQNQVCSPNHPPTPLSLRNIKMAPFAKIQLEMVVK